MTDLTDRMRTCAAHMLASDPHETLLPVYRDAADLLIEASNALEAVAQPQYPPGMPMAIIEPSHTPIPPTIDRNPSDFWVAPGGPLPGLKQSGTISPRVCPSCDSRATKTVLRLGDRMMLRCHVCGCEWPWRAHEAKA